MNKSYVLFLLILFFLVAGGVIYVSRGMPIETKTNESISTDETIPDNSINNTNPPVNGLNEEELTEVESITHIHGLNVDIYNPSKIYIATHDGLLLLKGDNELYRIGNSRADLMGFNVHPKNSKVFFSSGHPQNGGNIGFQKTEDGGQTWEVISEGVNGPVDFHAMAVSQSNPNVVYGWYSNKIQKTTDGGKTWGVVEGEIKQVINLQVDIKNENSLYATIPEGLVFSEDSGKSWSKLEGEIADKKIISIALNPIDENEFTVFVLAEGLFKTDDKGKTLSKVKEGFNRETILYIDYCKSDPKMIFLATTENNIFSTMDGGESWKKFKI